jgi:hypothetical protein
MRSKTPMLPGRHFFGTHLFEQTIHFLGLGYLGSLHIESGAIHESAPFPKNHFMPRFSFGVCNSPASISGSLL